MLAQDPAAADPVCDKSAHHHLIQQAIEAAARPRVIEKPLVFRGPKESRALDRAF
jgi:pyrroloquinoline quinone biosynthesis protein E